MHAISSYRGNSRPTPPATDRGDYNTLRRSLARSVKNILQEHERIYRVGQNSGATLFYGL